MKVAYFFLQKEGAPYLCQIEANFVMKLSSSAFANGAEIPRRYTCEGTDVSPPLAWTGAPTGVRSFALIVDDPDAPDPAAPKMTWVHWVVYNIPPTVNNIAEGASILPPGTLEGINDWKRARYGGPCPPIGRHRYFFKLYALDTMLPPLRQATKDALLNAMTKHVMAETELVGTYQKSSR